MTAQPAPEAGAPEHDVAISFLAKDQQIAGALAERLGESLKLFYYPRAQEQLAGTDGMETMRKPFVTDRASPSSCIANHGVKPPGHVLRQPQSKTVA